MKGNNGTNSEPVTWVREYKKGRIFYTSLGHQKDFEQKDFLRLISNAILWTAGQEVPK
jgi:type 1 glutamine amidotransferase